MKIFLSWSGPLSKSIAQAFNDWIPQVIQNTETWLSSEDIDKGSRWFAEIGNKLQEAQYGILFLTSQNLSSSWVLFEAGALSKSLEQSRVVPLLVDISNTDLQGPLAQFQATIFNKDDIKKLIFSINAKLETELQRPQNALSEAFDVWWPRLDKRFTDAISAHELQSEFEKDLPKRSIDDVLDEVLELVRDISRRTTQKSEFAAIVESNSTNSSISPRLSSIKKLSEDVGIPIDRFIEQLEEAGISVCSGLIKMDTQIG